MIGKDQAVTIAKTKLDEDVKRFQQIIDEKLAKYELDSIITIKIPNGMSVHVVNAIIDLYSEFQWTVERTSVTEGDQRDTYQVPALKFW